jgi:hypothetical protein
MIISKGQAGYIAETASRPGDSLTVSRPSPHFMGGEMNIVPSQDQFLVFDDKAVRAMGAAFDQACRSLRYFAHFDRMHDCSQSASLKLQKVANAIRSASIGKP